MISWSWIFSSRKSAGGRALGLLGKKIWAEIFEAGHRSDPAISAEMFQLVGFGRVWIFKPSLGQCQLEAKIIFFFSNKCPVIFFFFSSQLFAGTEVFLLY